MSRDTLLIATGGRGFVEISADLRRLVAASGVIDGLCHCFIHHTSASLLIMENADPAVLRDLERYISDLVVDGDSRFEHRAEGPDDMAAHIRSALTHTALTVPIAEGQLDLGTWQGVFLWEHRTAPHRRRLTISCLSD